jgi:IPT/TIG domain
MVTGVSPGCVDSGDSFTIHGTGLYPSLVQAVLVNGNAVDPHAITPISDTQLNVIAPDTIECHFGCPVEVQTNEGSSNTNFDIEISALCGG